MGQTDEVRFGIIGLGRGVYGAKDIKYTEGARLVSVCDLQEEKAKEVAKEFNCEWTTDYKQILARKDIDVVGIYTSSGTHCKFATESLNAGKHTYVTKPMDIRVDACNMAIDAADKNGLVLAVEFNRRYNEKFQKMAEEIHNGKLGRILLGDLRGDVLYAFEVRECSLEVSQMKQIYLERSFFQSTILGRQQTLLELLERDCFIVILRDMNTRCGLDCRMYPLKGEVDADNECSAL